MAAATASKHTLLNRSLQAIACTGAMVALLLLAPIPASASAGTGFGQASRSRPTNSHDAYRSTVKSRRHRAHRLGLRRRRIRARRTRARRLRHARQSAAVSSHVAVSSPKGGANTEAVSSTSDILDAGFEDGLLELEHRRRRRIDPDGRQRHSPQRRLYPAGSILTGTQDRSELILGGNGGGSTDGMIEFRRGRRILVRLLLLHRLDGLRPVRAPTT